MYTQFRVMGNQKLFRGILRLLVSIMVHMVLFLDDDGRV